MKLFRWLALAGSVGLAAALPGRGQSLPDTLTHADWRLYWASEFNTPGDSSTVADQWQFAYPWGRNLGSWEGQYYSGQQVETDSAGVLHLRARLRDTLRPYRAPDGRLFQLNHESGMLFSRFQGDSMRLPEFAGRPGFTYGLFEMRCRLPRTTPAFPAFWLFGHPDEVDIMEASPPDALSNNVHLWTHSYWRIGPPGAGHEYSQSSFFWPGPGHLNDDFHTFALIWEPNQLVFYFDGVAIRRETRFVPIGIPAALIADLCIPAWSRYSADVFDIDYIRVYKPRKPWPEPPISPKPPVVGMRQVPHTTSGVLNSVPPELRWRLHEQQGRRRLQLEASINPRHEHNLALPVRGEWFTPLSSYNDGDTPRHWLASPDSGRSALRWTLLDLSGHAVRSEAQAPAAGWVLRWDDLAPGAYTLVVQAGTWRVQQLVVHLGRPTETVFTQQWLAPLAPVAVAP